MRCYPIAIVLLLASCASPYVARVDAPKPSAVKDESAQTQKRPGAGQETKAFAPRAESSNDGAARIARIDTDQASTSSWLMNAVDECRAADHAAMEPTVVERTVYVDRPIHETRYVYTRGYGYGYDCYGNPIYVSDPYCRPYRSTFPVYTVTGATIGALSSGCSSSGRNIAVGAGIGLLFDSANWWW
jgi:hypothetical protein